MPDQSEEDIVYSDPYSCLPIANDKNAGNIDQIHLAGRGIQKLAKFDKFVSIDTLWLNNNKLDSLEGLESNFRLKSLYLHNNKIKRLTEACLSHCTFLNQLTLNNNLIDDLDNIIAELKGCHHLHSLDLFDNPVAQEDNYRLIVIGRLPSLSVLDRHEVTVEERSNAIFTLQKLASLRNFSLTSHSPKTQILTLDEKKHKEEVLAAAKKKFGVHTLHTRYSFESACMGYDKRGLGWLPIPIMMEIFEVMGVVGLGGVWGVEEVEVVLDRYTHLTPIPALTATSTLMKRLFDYRRFAEDSIPPVLRVLPPRKYVMTPTPDLSPSTSSLTKYVQGIGKKQLALIKSTGLGSKGNASMGGLEVEGGRVFESALRGSVSKCSDHNLSPNQSGEIMKIIKGYHHNAGMGGIGGGLEGMGSRADVEGVLKMILGVGIIPVQGVRGAISTLFTLPPSTSTPSISTPHTPTVDSLPWSIIADKLGATSTGTGGMGADIPLIIYTPLNATQLSQIEAKYNNDAQLGYNALLLTPTPSTSTPYTTTITNAIISTRLQALKKNPPTPHTHLLPHETITNAPARADIVVIPNMRADDAVVNQKQSIIQVGGTHTPSNIHLP